ncbi:MAG: hypothetical protein JWO67_2590 [Streptosporangiaceae bacterium]|nr:hypothetical protein [Streptosporangiaceae bacterium]
MTEDLLDPLRDDVPDEEPKADARALAKRASDVRPTAHVPQQTGVPEPPAYEDPTAGGARFLSHLLTRSPFLDYFCQVAESSYQGKTTEPKVRKAQQEHPVLFRSCVVADMILRIVVVLLILALIIAVAIKTLWPLIQ